MAMPNDSSSVTQSCGSVRSPPNEIQLVACVVNPDDFLAEQGPGPHNL